MANNPSFMQFMQTLIDELVSNCKFRTAETYSTTRNSFRRFLNDSDIPFEKMTREVIEKYELWLLSGGLLRNTTSFYMRVLRAAYNQAVERGFAPKEEIFKHVYTGVDKTGKRAVSLEVVRMLKQMDLTGNQGLALSRDLFLFSFYARGMSFVDMAYLRQSDLSAGSLHYARSKTGQRLQVKWEPCMQEIVDRYPVNPNGFLLPIITRPDRDFRHQYRSRLCQVNAGLRILSERLGLPVPVTTYVARHTWASVAYRQDIPVTVISEALGHDSERTTRIYLASIGTERVDYANSMIISLLK